MLNLWSWWWFWHIPTVQCPERVIETVFPNSPFGATMPQGYPDDVLSGMIFWQGDICHLPPASIRHKKSILSYLLSNTTTRLKPLVFLTRWSDAKYVYIHTHPYHTSIYIHTLADLHSPNITSSASQGARGIFSTAWSLCADKSAMMGWGGWVPFRVGDHVSHLGKKEHHLQKCLGTGDMLVPFSFQEGNTMFIQIPSTKNSTWQSHHIFHAARWPVGPSPNQSSSRPWQNHTMTGTKMVCPLGNQFEIYNSTFSCFGWLGTMNTAQRAVLLWKQACLVIESMLAEVQSQWNMGKTWKKHKHGMENTFLLNLLCYFGCGSLCPRKV